MKRLLILGLAVMLTLALGSAAMASTMGVNVSKGTAIDVERYLYDESDSDFSMIWGNYAPNDKILFKLSYAFDPFTNNDFSDELTFGIRYSIINNLALVANYTAVEDIDDKYDLGLRGKLNLSKKVDLTGELKYANNLETDEDAVPFWGQAEFKVSDFATLNAGLGFDDLGDVDSDTTYGILGAEFYIKKVTIYMDYYIYDDSDNNSACVGIDFAF
jgi:hypothetical protein